eukprot:SAG22_NODE_51_length_24458_cov_19.853161_2_plen_60_part_00
MLFLLFRDCKSQLVFVFVVIVVIVVINGWAVQKTFTRTDYRSCILNRVLGKLYLGYSVN